MLREPNKTGTAPAGIDEMDSLSDVHAAIHSCKRPRPRGVISVPARGSRRPAQQRGAIVNERAVGGARSVRLAPAHRVGGGSAPRKALGRTRMSGPARTLTLLSEDP